MKTVAVGESRHKLSNISPILEVADCSVCGPTVSLKRRTGGTFRCLASYRATKGKNSPKGARASGLRLRYGIGPTEYDSMLASQGGSCAICHESPDGQVLAVDHCHETGKVRGLLCRACNLALGFLADNPERLATARNYLLTHRS